VRNGFSQVARAVSLGRSFQFLREGVEAMTDAIEVVVIHVIDLIETVVPLIVIGMEG
jgi:hypothetical protein